jgi:hypothetical protein
MSRIACYSEALLAIQPRNNQVQPVVTSRLHTRWLRASGWEQFLQENKPADEQPKQHAKQERSAPGTLAALLAAQRELTHRLSETNAVREGQVQTHRRPDRRTGSRRLDEADERASAANNSVEEQRLRLQFGSDRGGEHAQGAGDVRSSCALGGQQRCRGASSRCYAS